MKAQSFLLSLIKIGKLFWNQILDCLQFFWFMQRNKFDKNICIYVNMKDHGRASRAPQGAAL